MKREVIDFTGHWELDYQLSDHTNEKIRWLYVQAKSDYERQIERSKASGVRTMDSSLGNFQSIIGLGRLAEIVAQATVLDITQDKNHIVIKRDEDFALICDFRSKEATRNTVGIEACGWRNDQLAFQIVLPDGLIVHHLLSLAADRSRMNIATTVAVSGTAYPFTLNRVYMPYEPGQGMFDCDYTIANQTTCSLGGSAPKE